MTRSRIIAGAIVAGATALGLLAGPVLGPLEDRVTALKYRLRGSVPPDSSIVLVTIDNEAIATLGWPVRRNFHALMIRALSDLGAAAIGVEMQFEQTSPEYPEYDALLASVTRSAGTVVVASYLGGLAAEGDGAAAPLFGTELHLPYPALREAAAGIGHVNLGEETEVPLFVSFGTGLIPAFALEVLRVQSGVPRDALRSDGGGVLLSGGNRTLAIPASADGWTRVGVPVRENPFPSYPFLAVLKAYDVLRSGGEPAIPLGRFAGKIVLIGVIAEGRGAFVPTLLHPRLPSLHLHAAFIDNALRSSFERDAPTWVLVLVCVLAAGAVGLGLLLYPAVQGRWIAWGTPVVCTGVSFGLFILGSVHLPLLPMLIACIAAGLPAVMQKHRRARRQVDALRNEKEQMAAELRDREAKLAVLERELLDAGAQRSADRTQELVEEIRRYKAEIRSLSARVEDMEEYRRNGATAPGEVLDFEGIIHSPAGRMRPVTEFVAKIAPSDAPVLVLGESGTGKELIARALHERSDRSAKPFVAVNCGALAETLLESELFGHERGAFTGAVKDRQGRFELAEGGTVFLDEIGDVSENFQLKLLRVLQEGEFERVGGSGTVRVDVRVIAATNRDLRGLVKEGRFREDLFYRLNVLTVELPPLRERPEDIPLLIDHLLRRERGDLRVSKNVMTALCAYGWPGNVRELESVMARAVLLARADKRPMITMQDIAPEVGAAVQGSVALEDQILQSVRERGFSRSAVTETAADLGGLNRGTVAEYLRGEFLKAFVDHGFRVDDTVQYLSLSPEQVVQDRVRKRLQEYLSNIGEGIDPAQPWEHSLPALRPKMKNLPQRYHRYLEQVAEAHYRGIWKEG